MLKYLILLTIPISFIPYIPIWIKDKKIAKQLSDKDKILNEIHK
jgi:hypothetical protein